MKNRAYNIIGILIGITLSLLIFTCKSNKQIRELSSQIKCTKTIYFVWDDASNLVTYDIIGGYKNDYASFGKQKRLNHKDLFIQSIEAFDKKYDGEYKYTENPGFPSDSVIVVKVKLKKVIRDFGFSKIMTDMQFEYATPDETLQIIGSSNGHKGSESYMKCFESANLQFLLMYCNQ